VVQYQSPKIGVYGPYQVNDYITKGADKEMIIVIKVITRNVIIIVS